MPTNLVAFAPRPGIVLRPSTRYAYVIRNEFAPGFGPPAAFSVLAQGNAPAGALGSGASALYAPLWPVLATAGIPLDDVLVATVFTTGDELGRVRTMTESLRAAQAVTIDNLALVNGDTYEGFCRLDGTVTMPQYQQGTQPFDSMGTFALDSSGVPTMQSTMTIPISITLPKIAMPSGGFPLYQFFHGSGGLSTDVVNLGYSPTSADIPTPGEGPGYIVAQTYRVGLRAGDFRHRRRAVDRDSRCTGATASASFTADGSSTRRRALSGRSPPFPSSTLPSFCVPRLKSGRPARDLLVFGIKK